MKSKIFLAAIASTLASILVTTGQHRDLREVLNSQKGRPVIEIPTGTYTLDVRGGGTYRFTGLTDVVINGNGSTVICNNQEQAFNFKDCVRVELRDLTIDYDPLCFTQGRITEVDPEGNWFDILIDRGYPLTGLVANRVQFYDPDTRLLKRNSITTYSGNYRSLENTGPGRFRLTKNGTWTAGEQPGDLVVLDVVTDKQYAGSHTIMLTGCYNMLLENVTVYGSNTFSFFETECYGTTYDRCVVDRGPMPEGIAPRLRSGNADGIHSSNARKGPTVVNCSVAHNGDDCIIVCGRSFPVSTADRGRKTIDIVTYIANPVLKKGDILQVVGFDGERKGELRLSSVGTYEPTEDDRTAALGKYSSIWSNTNYRRGFRLKVRDLPFDIEPGDVIYNASTVGSGFVIRDNEVGHVRSRGILIKGYDGVVENNTITGCAMNGILIAPEIEWMGGGFPTNITVKGNVIRECMFERSNGGIPPGGLCAMFVTGDRQPGKTGSLREILFEGNKVYDCPFPSIVAMAIDGLVLKDNEVSNTTGVSRNHGSVFGADSSVPVWKLNNIERDE